MNNNIKFLGYLYKSTRTVLFAILSLLCVIFVSSCNSLFFQPSRDLFYTPNQEKLDYEATSFRTSDGEEIQFWKIKPASPSKGVILHFHGNAENMSTHFRYVSWLAKEGFWVIPHDYRGYGKSTGVPEREKIILDSKLFFDSVFQDPQMKNLPKIAIGQSLGGALLVPELPNMVLNTLLESYWTVLLILTVGSLEKSFLVFSLLGPCNGPLDFW